MALSLLFFSAQFGIPIIRFFLSRLLYLTLVNLRQSSICHFLVFADKFFLCGKNKNKKEFYERSCFAYRPIMSIVCLYVTA